MFVGFEFNILKLLPEFSKLRSISNTTQIFFQSYIVFAQFFFIMEVYASFEQFKFRSRTQIYAERFWCFWYKKFVFSVFTLFIIESFIPTNRGTLISETITQFRQCFVISSTLFFFEFEQIGFSTLDICSTAIAIESIVFFT